MTSTKQELFIGRLPSDMEATAFREMFEKYGPLTRCDLKTSANGKYGFISYEDSNHADEALKELHNKEMSGNTINVEWAKSAPRTSRRRSPGRHSPYNSRRRGDRRRSRSPSPYVFIFISNVHSRRDRSRRDRSPRRRNGSRRDDRRGRSRSPRSPRRDDRRDSRESRDGRDKRRDERRDERRRDRRSRSRSRSPVERSRSPKKEDKSTR